MNTQSNSNAGSGCKPRLVMPPRFGDYSKGYCVLGFLLTKASFEEREMMVGHKLQKLEPGQVATCNREIEEATRLSPKSVQNALKALENSGQITRESSNRYSVITIHHWTPISPA